MTLRIDELAIGSADLDSLAPIPSMFSADGGNAIPRISFAGVPDGTVELALICHDPDAPLPNGFTHWVVYGITPDSTSVELSRSETRLGPNGAGDTAWSGPQPPTGHGVHHYYFWLYALNAHVRGLPGREEFIDRYGPHVIEQARLVGTFER